MNEVILVGLMVLVISVPASADVCEPVEGYTPTEGPVEYKSSGTGFSLGVHLPILSDEHPALPPEPRLSGGATVDPSCLDEWILYQVEELIGK